MNNILYVENLPPDITEGSLRTLFSQKGPVLEVKLVMDLATGRSRGKAFVTMATPEIAQTTVKHLHSHSVGGRNIAVTEARPVEERAKGMIGEGFEVGIGRGNQDRQPDPRQGRRPGGRPGGRGPGRGGGGGGGGGGRNRRGPRR